MYYKTTPFNKPPEFCEEDGRPLKENISYEDTQFDIYTGQKITPGRQVKFRWCPVYYPRHKFSAWQIKEGDYNWVRFISAR
jgi:hypothetical protein